MYAYVYYTAGFCVEFIDKDNLCKNLLSFYKDFSLIPLGKWTIYSKAKLQVHVKNSNFKNFESTLCMESMSKYTLKCWHL